MELRMQTGALTPAAISGKRNTTEKLSQTGQPSLPPVPHTAPASVGNRGATLPALDVALDRAAMTKFLRPQLSAIVPPEQEITVTQVELLDYKPGQRGLIRYELVTKAHATHVIFGKLYADASQLNRVDQTLALLWNEVFGDDLHCSIPQPLGVISELGMLVYVPAEGVFLDEVLTGERGTYAMELTGRWLAILHRQPLKLTKHFQLANELANLAIWAEIVGQSYPDLAPLANHALAYLQQQATVLPLATQTPIHKDFHYRHVLVERGVKVIDFDELRLGDPNFDLAHFCVNLHLLAYRQTGSPCALHNLEQRFLAAYARNTGWTLTDDQMARFTYFSVYTCLKLARQLCLGFGPSPIPTGEERQRQVQLILRQAATAIATIANGRSTHRG